MKPHTWEVEEVDGGPVGIGHFWVCRACGASGGPACWGKWKEAPQWPPFLAGTGVTLSTDCDEAKRVVDRLRDQDGHTRLLHGGGKAHEILPYKCPTCHGPTTRSNTDCPGCRTAPAAPPDAPAWQPPATIPPGTKVAACALPGGLLAVKLRRPDEDPHTYGIYRDGQYQGELLTLAEVGARALD